MLKELAAFFREGGPFMYLNLVFMTFALATITERVLMLMFRLNLDSRAFMAQIQKLIMSNNVDRAIKLCASAPNAALSHVIRAGLTRANRGQREISRALEESVLEVTPRISKRVATLWSIANIATLVGLIGTITGLIATFKALGAASAEMKQIMLSRGISEAMNNTAFGLMIAVMCIVAHMILHNKSKAIVDEIEFHALRLESMLTQRGAGEVNPLDRA
ncbi:MAG: MotA/TolQ/ExbB proton channel family protein [Myxococcota bacterium]